METAIQELALDLDTFQLTNRHLTAAYHLEHLVAMTTVDLSYNVLTSLTTGYLLQSVRILNLSHNKLKTCDGIENLPCLLVLNISHNGEYWLS